jgi:hypothetical protein
MSRPDVDDPRWAWKEYADELQAELDRIRPAAKASMKGCTRCWGKVKYSGKDFEACVCAYCADLAAALLIKE